MGKRNYDRRKSHRKKLTLRAWVISALFLADIVLLAIILNQYKTILAILEVVSLILGFLFIRYKFKQRDLTEEINYLSKSKWALFGATATLAVLVVIFFLQWWNRQPDMTAILFDDFAGSEINEELWINSAPGLEQLFILKSGPTKCAVTIWMKPEQMPRN